MSDMISVVDRDGLNITYYYPDGTVTTLNEYNTKGSIVYGPKPKDANPWLCRCPDNSILHSHIDKLPDSFPSSWCTDKEGK